MTLMTERRDTRSREDGAGPCVGLGRKAGWDSETVKVPRTLVHGRGEREEGSIWVFPEPKTCVVLG